MNKKEKVKMKKKNEKKITYCGCDIIRKKIIF